MARPHLEHVHSPELTAQPVGWSGWPAGATAKELSRDPDAGAVTALVELPAGYRLPAGAFGADTELLLLGGALRLGDTERRAIYYDFAPAGAAVEAVEALEPARLLVMGRTGPPDIAAGEGEESERRIRLDVESMPWGGNPAANGPPTIEVKILRYVDGTGEMSALVRGGPREYPVYEYHDCVEEVFLIEGDVTLGNSGTMRPDSYFWRPAYVTHGQARSEAGSLYYLYVDSELVNRTNDGFHRTPEENRRLARASE